MNEGSILRYLAVMVKKLEGFLAGKEVPAF